VGVERVNTKTSSPYKVVIGVHSLQQGRFGVIIEYVTIMIRQTAPAPYPLRLWVDNNELRDYHSNPYQVTYRGENIGAVLTAAYVPQPIEHIQLVPGESDELDIQVLSRVIIDLHFQVQVTYRVVNEPQLYKLMLPNIFEVIFSDASNWHPYYLIHGHLEPYP
jgi:hypothetical protein